MAITNWNGFQYTMDGKTYILYKNSDNIICAAQTTNKIEISSCGKNLFDKTKTTDGVGVNNANGQTTARTEMSVTDYIICEPNKSYKFTGFDLIDGTQHGAFYDFNKNFINGFYSSDATGISPLNAKYFRYTIPTNNKNTFMITESINSDSIYESYKETKTEISLDEPLRSLPNGIKDTIDNYNVLTRRVKMIKLNGEEDLVIEDTTKDNTFLFSIKLIDDAKTSINNSNILCDKFLITDTDIYLSDSEGIQIDSSGKLLIRMYLYDFDTLTVEELIKWLNYNTITVLYELKTPITTKVDYNYLPKSYKDGYLINNNLITPEINIDYSTNIIKRIAIAENCIDNNSLDIAHIKETLKFNENLLPNSTGLMGLYNWHLKNNSLIQTKNNINAFYVQDTCDDIAKEAYCTEFKIEAEKMITLSALMYKEKDEGHIGICVNFFNNTMNFLSQLYIPCTETGIEKLYYNSIITPPDTSLCCVAMMYRKCATPNLATWRNIKLEYGDKYTRYSNEADIKMLYNRITFGTAEPTGGVDGDIYFQYS